MAETRNVAGSEPTIVLHWLEKSRSHRFAWLLEECKGVQYEIKTYRRQSDASAPPALKTIHPLGKAPVVTIQFSSPPRLLTLAESGSIAEYLCDYYGRHLIPPRYLAGKDGQIGEETEQWFRYRYFMHYAEGSLIGLLIIAYLFDNLRGPQVPCFLRPLTRAIANRVDKMFLAKNFTTHFEFLEGQLDTSPDGGQYLCGRSLTAADILMSFPLILAKARIDKVRYPRLVAYIKLLENLPSHVSATRRIEQLTEEPVELVL